MHRETQEEEDEAMLALLPSKSYCWQAVDCTRPQRAHTEMLDALDTLERLLMKQGSSLCSLEIYLYEEDKAGSLPDGYH